MHTHHQLATMYLFMSLGAAAIPACSGADTDSAAGDALVTEADAVGSVGTDAATGTTSGDAAGMQITSGTTTAVEATTDACDEPGADPGLCGQTTVASTTSTEPPAMGEWWRQVGGPDLDVVHDLAIAMDGDIIVVGAFRGTVDFGGGSTMAALLEDAFIARYTPDGTLRWMNHFGSTAGGFDNAQATGVAVDGAGHVLVTGTFEGTVDPGTGALVSAGKDDIFVVRYSADGEPLWSRRSGGDGFERAGKIAADVEGNALLAGTQSSQLFVTKLDAAGGEDLWFHGLGPVLNGVSDRPPVNDVATDAAGDLYIVGSFYGEAFLGGGLLESAGGNDVFLARYRGTDGAHVWSSRHGGSAKPNTGGDDALGLAVDGGNLVICGVGWGPIDMGGGVLDAPESGPVAFLARYSALDGAHVWSRRLQSSRADRLALSGDSMWVLGLVAPGDPSSVRIGQFDPADGAEGDQRIVPGSGELALSGDGRMHLAISFRDSLVADGEMFTAAGASDFLIGPFSNPEGGP